MCADSTRADAADSVQLTGLVQRVLRDAASRNAHEAVVLQGDDGNSYLLRRPGGNPFADPVLQSLCGRRLLIRGQARAHYLLVNDWREITP